MNRCNESAFAKNGLTKLLAETLPHDCCAIKLLAGRLAVFSQQQMAQISDGCIFRYSGVGRLAKSSIGIESAGAVGRSVGRSVGSRSADVTDDRSGRGRSTGTIGVPRSVGPVGRSVGPVGRSDRSVGPVHPAGPEPAEQEIRLDAPPPLTPICMCGSERLFYLVDTDTAHMHKRKRNGHFTELKKSRHP